MLAVICTSRWIFSAVEKVRSSTQHASSATQILVSCATLVAIACIDAAALIAATLISAPLITDATLTAAELFAVVAGMTSAE